MMGQREFSLTLVAPPVAGVSNPWHDARGPATGYFLSTGSFPEM